MNWPTGKYNGRRIAGFRCNIRLNIFWWAWNVWYQFGELRIHLGPFHCWISAEFEL